MMPEICDPLDAVRNDFAYNAQRRFKQNGVLSQRLLLPNLRSDPQMQNGTYSQHL
ncbi:hypothetical protein [Pseudomonas brassicacearum]|uniref:hypothetical protein n=1 Tax=Pseudomonas brassicacearum TaxID=930166 RepID=UPI001619E7DE|nr:hypothetical protein [Pseudomonas brassicacearum]